MREIKMFGGVFAPPLTDETLAKYRRLAASMPDSEQRFVVYEILRCVEAWWGLPESDPSNTDTHPVGPTMMVGGKVVPAPRVVRLSGDVAAAIDEHLPWEAQAEVFTRVLSSIESEAASRNAIKLSEWRAQVFERRLLEAKIPIDLRGSECQMLSACLASIGKFGPVAAVYIDRLIDAFLPGKRLEDLEQAKAAFVAVRDLAQAECDSGTAIVPKPELESTEIRDMAHHLNWFVHELLAGREPVTNDKI